MVLPQCSEVFKDENGYLKLEYCSDRNSMGMHFTYDGAKVWVNYLKTHIPRIFCNRRKGDRA